jgi:hypothetical protein
MSEIECPYCGEGCGYPDEHQDEGVPVEMQCPHCDKNFVYYAEYSVDYDSEKAPCLNGEEHKWEPIIGAPEEFFKDKYRCKFCQEERKIEKKDVVQG